MKTFACQGRGDAYFLLFVIRSFANDDLLNYVCSPNLAKLGLQHILGNYATRIDP
jgi:hypothetical protein